MLSVRDVLASSPRDHPAPVWFTGTVAIGIALSVAFFLLVRSWERVEHTKRAAEIVESQLDKLRISMLRSIEVLHSVRSLFTAEGSLEPEEFSRFVGQALQRQSELQALSWNPVVSHETRTAFESRHGFAIRERDATGLMVPARPRATYVPVSLIQPVAGNDEAMGFDLNSDPLRQESLERARVSGKPIGTSALRLAQGPRDLTGFLVILPVSREGVEGREIVGYAVAVFRVPALVKGIFDELAVNGVEAELHDSLPSGPVIYTTAAPRLKALGQADLEFAEHRWSVRYGTTATFVPPGRAGQSWMVLIAGLAFTGLTGAYLLNAARTAQEVSVVNQALQLEIVERKRAEEAAAGASKAKSDFLANMSHEMRTPLNAILGYAQLLQRDLHLAPEQRDSVSGIQGSGSHLLGLINEVLDLAKIEAGKMELHVSAFDLDVLSKSILATFRPLCAQKRIGLAVKIEAAGKPRRVRGDEGKLRQVLINLLGNAVKFTVVGEVCLIIRHISDQEWRFEVIDSGLGIPDEERASIFEPFHQGKGAQHFGGTGLGLAIAHRQVEVMGGRLDFVSERGVGTRFFFELRLEAASPGIEQAVPCREVDSPSQFPALMTVRLPEDLRSRLMLAAELHSATALKTALRELRELGPEAERVAAEIRNLMRSYDMEGIQSLLDRMTLGRPAEGPHALAKL